MLRGRPVDSELCGGNDFRVELPGKVDDGGRCVAEHSGDD